MYESTGTFEIPTSIEIRNVLYFEEICQRNKIQNKKKLWLFYCKSILDVQCCANKNTLKTLHYQIGNLLQITPTSDVALESNKQGRICQKEGKK